MFSGIVAKVFGGLALVLALHGPDLRLQCSPNLRP
jgi:hypothetical protein